MQTEATGWSHWTKISWTLMFLGAVLVVFFSARYFTLDPEVYFERQRETYIQHETALLLHIGAMFVAILLGPWQFLPGLRAKRPVLHRTIGKIYITGAMVGAVGGIWLAPVSASGAISGVSFVLLGLGVLITTGNALRLIRRRRIEEHRAWMTRSYALVLAGLTLRLYLPFLESVFSDYTAYAIVAWACWLPNLVVAEWLIRRRARPAGLTGRPLESAENPRDR